MRKNARASSRRAVRVVRLRVGDVARQRIGDVDGREGRDLVARPVVGEDDRALGHLRRASASTSPAVSRLPVAGRSSQWVKPCSATGSTARSGGRGRDRRRCGRALRSGAGGRSQRGRAAPRRRRGRPRPRARARPGRARSRSRPGRRAGRRCPAASPTGSAPIESSRARTAAPPATANANGTKPAARRACEIETASANRVKRSGTSISTSTARKPPSTNAAQRRRPASTASGTAKSATTAIAPLRPKHLGREPVAAVREDVELGAVVLERPLDLVRRRVDGAVSRAIGRSQSATAPAGKRRPPQAPAAPSSSSVRASSARATTYPASGSRTKSA